MEMRFLSKIFVRVGLLVCVLHTLGLIRNGILRVNDSISLFFWKLVN
jgi:hypothetical protein